MLSPLSSKRSLSPRAVPISKSYGSAPSASYPLTHSHAPFPFIRQIIFLVLQKEDAWRRQTQKLFLFSAEFRRQWIDLTKVQVHVSAFLGGRTGRFQGVGRKKVGTKLDFLTIMEHTI